MLRRLSTTVLKGLYLPGHPSTTPAAILNVILLVLASCAIATFLKRKCPAIAALFFGGR